MNYDEMERTLNRICAGGKLARVRDGSNKTVYVLIKEPTLKDKIWTDFLYEQALTDGKERNLLPSSELLSLYRSTGLWTDQMDAEVKGLQTVIEELERTLINPDTSRSDLNKIQKVKRVTEDKLHTILAKKSDLLSMSLERHAEMERIRAIVFTCAYTSEDARYWPTWEVFEAEEDSKLIESITSAISDCIYTIDSKIVRKLARSSMWRIKWSAAKNNCDNLFGKPLIYLTRNQESLIYWSQVYDSVYEAYERPSEDVINDDDALDKWFESQSAKRKHDDITKGRDSGKFNLSSNVRKHGEIGIVTNPAINSVPEWVRGANHKPAPDNAEVQSLNDPLAKKFLGVQNRRIKEAGVIDEQQLRGDKDSRRVIGGKDAITHKARGKDGFTRRVVDKTLPGGTISGKNNNE